MNIQPLNAQTTMTLGEICTVCRVHTGFVIELVNEGIIEPLGQPESNWHFDGYAVVRIRKAVRLQRDLGVNLAGVGLALELMQHIERLTANSIR